MSEDLFIEMNTYSPPWEVSEVEQQADTLTGPGARVGCDKGREPGLVWSGGQGSCTVGGSQATIGGCIVVIGDSRVGKF